MTDPHGDDRRVCGDRPVRQYEQGDVVTFRHRGRPKERDGALDERRSTRPAPDDQPACPRSGGRLQSGGRPPTLAAMGLKSRVLGHVGWLPVAVLLFGCGSGSSTALGTDSDKYTQTWPTSYGRTTCADWSGSMTAQQRFAAAADILTATSSEVPSDDLANRLVADISEACSAPAATTQTLTDVSAAVTLLDPDYQ